MKAAGRSLLNQRVLLRSIATRSPPHADEASLYVHWPYCLKRCSYCNFNKYISRSQSHTVMRECLQRETQTLLQLGQISRINSVFFGGGTPSLAQPCTIAAVLETVSKHAHVADDAEVTLEVNPTPAGKASLKDFMLAGVNRFSIGVQSLSDDHLRTLGRDHNSQHALQTVSEARTLCPGRVSVDFMFALPGQSVKSWASELKKLLPVCDDHVSLYQLTLERGTQLFKLVESGELRVPGDDVTAVMYQSAREILEQTGFRQYEVSNFSKNNAVSEHNIGYWKGQQYIGVGPGAHGRFVPRAVGGAQREARTQTLEPDVWIREVQRLGHGTRRRIQLDHHGLLEEVLVMGLRMNEGITQQHWRLFSPDADLYQMFGMSDKFQELQAGGLLILDDRGLRCSWEGLALLDSILPTMLLELESLSDDHLRTLGRDHNSQHALQTVSEARTLCPGRVSVDFMFALPGQSVKSWASELKKLLPVCDDHVSLYQLTLERGTQLFKLVESGELRVPGDDVTAVMYQSAREILEQTGFRQYEVSNFSKNNAVSEHNIGYWKGQQYIGVGPGAHGRFVPRAVGGAQREARTQTLEPDVWIREVQRLGHGTRRRIQLDHHGLLEEVLVMGLRMNEGITQQHWRLFSPDADLYQMFGMSDKFQELQAGGLLILDDRGLRCSWEGLALLDSILPTMLLELEVYLQKDTKQQQ